MSKVGSRVQGPRKQKKKKNNCQSATGILRASGTPKAFLQVCRGSRLGGSEHSLASGFRVV